MTMMSRGQYELNVGRIAGMASMGGGGNGWVVPIADKNLFTFTGSTAGGAIDVNLAQTINSTGWVSGVLVTRVFTAPTFSATGTLNIYVVNSFVAPDDPATLFGPATPTTTFVSKSMNIISTTAAGVLDVVALNSAPIGPSLRVFMEYSQGATAGGGNVTLGIMLVGRPA